LRNEALKSEKERDATAACLAEFNLPWVITDVAGRRDLTHMHITSHTLVVRWVGNDLSPTDYHRLQEWSMRLKTIITFKSLKNIYFFIHEPDNVHAPEMVAYLSGLLSDTILVKNPKPVHLDKINEKQDLFS
jgi:uncharacterized protein YecE (DUF72 family)